MKIGLLTLVFRFPGCASLKEKRGRLKPVLTRLHREFNLSTAEIDRQDVWDEAVVACAMVAGNGANLQAALQDVIIFTGKNWPENVLWEHRIELI